MMMKTCFDILESLIVIIIISLNCLLKVQPLWMEPQWQLVILEYPPTRVASNTDSIIK